MALQGSAARGHGAQGQDKKKGARRLQRGGFDSGEVPGTAEQAAPPCLCRAAPSVLRAACTIAPGAVPQARRVAVMLARKSLLSQDHSLGQA